MDQFLDYFLPKLAKIAPEQSALIETIATGYKIYKPLIESASTKLYHFCNFSSLRKILTENRMPLNFAEQNHNGKGLGFISFSRTSNLREGFPVLFHSDEWGRGDDWCIIRINFNGDRINQINRFKQNRKYHTINVKPFDWVNHEFGNTIKDEFEVDDYQDATIDTGKTWMMHSPGISCSNVPVGPSDGFGFGERKIYNSFDKDAHPYAQAEDRLCSTAKYIPDIKKYIDSIDIILLPENFSRDNYIARKQLSYLMRNNNIIRNNGWTYMSRRDMEHHKPIMNAIRILTSPNEERGGSYYMREEPEYW